MLRCSVLCGFVGGREVGVQLRRERPRLRPVYRHLDEAHRAPVGAQPAARLATVGIEAGDPPLVGVTPERSEFTHRPVAPGGVPARHPGPLGQVVVIGARPVGVQVVARSRRRAAVHLHSAVHLTNHFQ
jgi:hypothetical protein